MDTSEGVVELYDYRDEIGCNKKGVCDEFPQDKCMFGLPKKLDFLSDGSNIILCGMTRSGKTTLLHSILGKLILPHIKPKNIIIFSKTAAGLDESYAPLVGYIAKNTDSKIKIYDDIDMSIINKLILNQEKDK